MYFIGDIAYGGELTEDIKIDAVKVLRGGMYIVTFSTGEKRLFDTTELKGEVFEPLAEEKIVNNPVLYDGIITWDNGKIDVAPEFVYQNSYAYTDKSCEES